MEKSFQTDQKTNPEGVNKEAEKNPRVSEIWKPFPGSQRYFLNSPVRELLYEGERGPGKTDCMLMDFAQHVGVGYGQAWSGVIFRQTYKQLKEVKTKAYKWFKRVWPKSDLNKSSMTWNWPSGEQLLLRYIDDPDDYWNYHGHEYPYIAFDELTNWPTNECYEAMKSCCRSTHPEVPRKIRASANPWGKGHNWVKNYFIDPGNPGELIENDQGQVRSRVHGMMHENKALMENDPDYVKELQSTNDPQKRKAWLGGSWDIVAGGMFDDLWDEEVHVIEPFEIPEGWYVDRSLDWGSSAPFSVGWWAESDGSRVTMANGEEKFFPKGTLIRIGEYYGWNGKPNEGLRLSSRNVAQNILDCGPERKYNVKPGPADNQIWGNNDESNQSIAEKMADEGVEFERADQSSGSRVNGWQLFRDRLEGSLESPMENPGLFIFSTCDQFIRTIPILPRDEKDPDDVDKSGTEDHVADESRYRILHDPVKTSARQGKITGP